LSERLENVMTPIVPEGYRHVFHQYTIRVANGRRDALADHLKANGVGHGIYYPVPVHQQTFYTKTLGYDVVLPEAERAADEVLSLPVHPGLTDQDLQTIVEVVNDFTTRG
jgi:dTDP-4-amino-4,6-dideoxygalactose transaminase